MTAWRYCGLVAAGCFVSLLVLEVFGTFRAPAQLRRLSTVFFEARDPERRWPASSDDRVQAYTQPQIVTYDCMKGVYSDWLQDQRDYCCILKGLGCPSNNHSPPSFESGRGEESNRNEFTDVVEITSTPMPSPGVQYTCVASSSDEELNWSSARKSWCCSRWGVACGSYPASQTFNCQEGLWNSANGWSDAKKMYCCKNEHLGCEDGGNSIPATGVDCSKVSSNPADISHCCQVQMFSAACPFNCHAGLDDAGSWSGEKALWCCTNAQLGCSSGTPTPIRGGCRSTQFGCCADGKTAARSLTDACKNFKGPGPAECLSSFFGCCADGITAAQSLTDPCKSRTPSLVPARKEIFMRITCPFLSTMVNEGVLPVKASYSKDELIFFMQGVAGNSLFTKSDWLGAANGNFKFFPTGFRMDIFNMDGALNEHQTSTGITDCASTYTSCSMISTCRSTTVPCSLPNLDRFEMFWNDLIKNSDGTASLSDAFANIGSLWSGPNGKQVDTDDLAVNLGGGTISGSFTNLIKLFGRNGKISKTDMQRILIERRFPSNFFRNPVAL